MLSILAREHFLNERQQMQMAICVLGMEWNGILSVYQFSLGKWSAYLNDGPQLSILLSSCLRRPQFNTGKLKIDSDTIPADPPPDWKWNQKLIFTN